MKNKLLVVGTMAYDAIETPLYKVDRILGGAAIYIALASSKFDIDCGLVSVIGDDFEDSDLKILQDLDFKNIKVNAVLLKGINDTYEDFEKFGNFIKNNKESMKLWQKKQSAHKKIDHFIYI